MYNFYNKSEEEEKNLKKLEDIFKNDAIESKEYSENIKIKIILFTLRFEEEFDEDEKKRAENLYIKTCKFCPKCNNEEKDIILYSFSKSNFDKENIVSWIFYCNKCKILINVNGTWKNE
jgi:hypothetical protein